MNKFKVGDKVKCIVKWESKFIKGISQKVGEIYTVNGENSRSNTEWKQNDLANYFEVIGTIYENPELLK